VAFGGSALGFLVALGIHVATFVIHPIPAEYVHDLLGPWSLPIFLLWIAVLPLVSLATPKSWRELERQRTFRARWFLTDAPTSVRLLYALGLLLGLYAVSNFASSLAISPSRSTTLEQLIARELEQEIQLIRGISALWMASYLMVAVGIAEWLGFWHRREANHSAEQGLAGHKV